MEEITEAEFQAHMAQFPEQMSILGVRVYADITRSHFGESTEENASFGSINSSIGIRSDNQLLFDDFTYLRIFKQMEALYFISPSYRGRINIGKNLHCNLKLVHLAFKNYKIESIHNDFRLLTPQLHSFLLLSSFENFHGINAAFPKLEKLHLGYTARSSRTDFNWCQNIVTLKELKLINVDLDDIDDFNPADIGPNIERLGIIFDNLSSIPESWLRLSELMVLNLENNDFTDFPVGILSQFPKLIEIHMGNSEGASSYRNDYSSQKIVFDMTLKKHQISISR